jgi:hypothetical protein
MYLALVVALMLVLASLSVLTEAALSRAPLAMREPGHGLGRSRKPLRARLADRRGARRRRLLRARQAEWANVSARRSSGSRT